MFKRLTGTALLVSAFLLAAGCGLSVESKPGGGAPAASCDIFAAILGGPSGRATFVQRQGTLHVEVQLEGLSPGLHGIHLHEKGDCSDKAMAAGGHFNPDGHMHGMAEGKDSHAGDFGNINADANGRGTLSFDDPYLSLQGSHSVVGLSLVVHADPDDMKTQPSGNSGARIACGIINRVTQ
jgi:Cu-Zn family superoxide dismutase